MIRSVLILLSACLLPCAVVRADITTGLVGYWRFDENTGASAADLSGQGNNGTLKPSGNKPAWVAGRIGLSALTCNGNDNGISVPSSFRDELNPINNISVSAWVNVATSKSSRVVTKGWGDSYAIEMSVTNQVSWRLISVAGDIALTSDQTLTNGVWYHLVGTYDAGTTVKLYINGIEEKSSAYANQLNGWAQNVGIGNIPHTLDNLGYLGNGFAGSIDDVRIYSRALTAADVKELYELGLSKMKNVTLHNAVIR
jgi:hypothetical protein